VEPDWSLLPYPHLEQLPALQWRLQNLKELKRHRAKFDQQHDELAARLGQVHKATPGVRINRPG
jgi:hypothetical protein